jgi:predicted transcriptional regulator
MHEKVQQFVECMGLLLESERLPRIAGRMFGLLLVSEAAQSLDDLAERLQVSKASTSTNARFLEQMGLIERVAQPGDRRDYYQIDSGAVERMLAMARKRWVAMRDLMAQGADALPPEMGVAAERLRGAEQFHTLLLEHSDELLQQWRTRCCPALREAAVAEDQPRTEERL